MVTNNGFDIFGVPLEYASEIARKTRWPSYIWRLSELTRTDISRTFKNTLYDIYNCVFLGFLSFRSASYFCLGKFTPAQDDYLKTCVDFIYNHQNCSTSKLRALWTGKSVPENMFVFPLVELGSESEAKFEFSVERDEYIRRSSENLKKLMEHKRLLDSDDLPF